MNKIQAKVIDSFRLYVQSGYSQQVAAQLCIAETNLMQTEALQELNETLSRTSFDPNYTIRGGPQ